MTLKRVPSEQVLHRFVDRREALTWFRHLVDEPSGAQRAMWIHGQSGIGKSMLLSRLIKECCERDVRWLHAEWRDTRRFGYLDLMRRLRDEAGRDELFQLFNDQVNHFTSRDYDVRVKVDLGDIQNVRVLEDGRIQGGSGAQINVGHHIDDLRINVIRPDFDAEDRHIRIELTRAFVPCLQALARESPVVLLLDALEKADDATMTWIVEELLERLSRGELENVLLVLAGQVAPADSDQLRFDRCMRTWELKPLKPADVEELLRKDLDEEQARTLAGFMAANEQYLALTPLQVSMQVLNFRRYLVERGTGG